MTTKPTLVLDLDNTLVYSTTVRLADRETHTIKFGSSQIFIYSRPGLATFLSSIKKLYDVYFFTASQKDYANKVIDYISPDTPTDHRLFRESCVVTNGFFVKDLNLISTKLQRILLIDDNPDSAYFQPMNLIRPSFYKGEQNDETLLKELLPLLQKVCLFNDMTSAAINIIKSNKCKGVFHSF